MFIHSDPIINSNTNERSKVNELLEKLILEEDQFDVHDILPNTVPDPSSLLLESDYACPAGQVVMAPDCGMTNDFLNVCFSIKIFLQCLAQLAHITTKTQKLACHVHWALI